MENQLTNIQNKSVNFCWKKRLLGVFIKLESVFLYFLANQDLLSECDILFGIADDNIWFASQNLKDQNPKQFKKSFPS